MNRRDYGPVVGEPYYPRVVKRTRHNSYRIKRPGDTGTRHAGPPTIDLVNLRPPGTTPSLINLG